MGCRARAEHRARPMIICLLQAWLQEGCFPDVTDVINAIIAAGRAPAVKQP